MYKVFWEQLGEANRKRSKLWLSPSSVFLFLETSSFFAFIAVSSSPPTNIPTSWTFPCRGECVSQERRTFLPTVIGPEWAHDAKWINQKYFLRFSSQMLLSEREKL